MNKVAIEFYERDDVLVILTTAPTGLGHVRVTRAVKEGLPKIANVEVLGISNAKFQMLHRIASVNRKLRAVMEFAQNDPVIEKKFARLYRRVLRKNPSEVENQVLELVKRFRPKPKHVVIVATHFSLAHQLGEIKKSLSKKLKTQVHLAVIVTDDSPQPVWAVYDADYVFVPSYETKQSLINFLKLYDDPQPEFVVNPYPISGQLSKKLSDKEWSLRKKQLQPKSKEPLRVMIPISGAAVQLEYFQELIQELSRFIKVKVIVVSRDSKHTRKFLIWCSKQKDVEVVTYKQDFEVVRAFERMYWREVIGVEITKPSEQSFKCLHTPRMRGGSALLFSDPVGRQEDDNVAFMRRFGLMPSMEEEEMLGSYMKSKNEPVLRVIHQKARSWRGLMIPPLDGRKAAERIFKLRESGVLLRMMAYEKRGGNSDVISYKGVQSMWEYLAEELK